MFLFFYHYCQLYVRYSDEDAGISGFFHAKKGYAINCRSEEQIRKRAASASIRQSQFCDVCVQFDYPFGFAIVDSARAAGISRSGSTDVFLRYSV